ncbi:MAG TPA: DEAD/DEAH box helicase, partial [Micropepsaceae bacterium]|nr:DEAD/DEAH box helicase [Micropepsaceae bacterium]
LAAENYSVPTPIQAQAIPLVLAGRDVLGIAQTGTGKTAAFGLPLMQRLVENRATAAPNTARALILAPTRELAIQIDESLRSYGRHLKLRHAVILGGVNQNRQVQALRRGVDVLVATPGRLLDLIQQKHLRLNAVTELVIDEADRMFDMGFIRDVRRIVSHLPRERQSMLFSATMPAEVSHLVAEILRDPARIDISPKTVAAEKIEQRVYFVAAQEKRLLLQELLGDAAMKRVIVFTRTKHGANKVAEHLGKAGHVAEAIHGNKSQNARQRALEEFRSGRARVLVATDIAARGIDIDGVTHVVYFELPDVAESYVHRIGRTARAGTGGVAIAFCDPAERDSLRAIERLVKQPLTSMGGDRHATAPQPERGRAHDRSHQRPRGNRRSARRAA